MTSELIVHFYLADETRTACGLPIRGVNLISRFYDQTECQACIATDSWKEAAAAAMERALSRPVPTDPFELNQEDWLKAFEEPENAFFSKYLLKKLEAFKTTPPSNAFIPIGFDASDEVSAQRMENALNDNRPPIPVQGPVRRVELPGGNSYELGPAQYFGAQYPR